MHDRDEDGMFATAGVVLVVNRDNLDWINDNELGGGFELNPNSLRNFVPKGIRILERPGSGVSRIIPVGELITGTKEHEEDSTFLPVYSIRQSKQHSSRRGRSLANLHLAGAYFARCFIVFFSRIL